MSWSQAVARAKVLKESLLDHGVRTVSIELVEGRGGRGWYDDHHIASMGHHIVSRRSQGDTPFLNLCKKGRADLPGPICNGYGGFDLVARIICMGWANHSGQGGPVTVEAGTIPQNNGRPYFFGWEFEGGISESDWRDENHEFMAQCLAGTLDYLASERGREITELSHHEHKSWAPGRKSDRLGYSLSEARALIAKYGGDMVRRDDKADDGLDIHEEAFNKAISAGGFSKYTQPGGVAFNDELATFMSRLGLFDVFTVIKRVEDNAHAKIRALEAQNAALASQLAALKSQVGSGGGGLAPGTRFEAEVQ